MLLIDTINREAISNNFKILFKPTPGSLLTLLAKIISKLLGL